MRRKPTARASSFEHANLWFKVHTRIAEQPTVTDNVPDELQHCIIPGATCCYTFWKGNYILTQKLPVLGYIVWSHRLSIREDTLLYPVTNIHLATLNYTMKGVVDCWIQGFGAAQLQQMKYQLYFLPALGINKAWLKPGAYEFFHIALPIDSIEKLIDKHPNFQVLLDLLQRDNKGTTFPELFPVTRTILRQIDRVRTYKGLSAAGDFFLLSSIVALLNIYLEDITRYENRGELMGSFSVPMEGLEEYIRDNLCYLNLRGDGNLLSVSRLTALFKMSKYQLATAIHDKYKMTLEELIYKIRQEKAKDMVMNQKDMDLEGVAFELGYSSLSSFSRAFKEYHKATPSEFRRKRWSLKGIFAATIFYEILDSMLNEISSQW